MDFLILSKCPPLAALLHTHTIWINVEPLINSGILSFHGLGNQDNQITFVSFENMNAVYKLVYCQVQNRKLKCFLLCQHNRLMMLRAVDFQNTDLGRI
jgi:hypothetical protein